MSANTLVAVALPFALAAILVGVFILWRPRSLRRLFASRGFLILLLAVEVACAAVLAIHGDWPGAILLGLCALLLARSAVQRLPR